jgi:hypothetical protein
MIRDTRYVLAKLAWVCGENLAPASAHSMLLRVSLSDGSNCGDYALSRDNAACIRIPAGADGALRESHGIRAC